MAKSGVINALVAGESEVVVIGGGPGEPIGARVGDVEESEEDGGKDFMGEGEEGWCHGEREVVRLRFGAKRDC